MSRTRTGADGEPRGSWILSEIFARYAEADLDRWRQIIGYHVTHNDARWGIGEVVSVSWGTCCDHVPDYVQIKISYEGGWTVIGHSATWQRHHRNVSVPALVATAIHTCLESDLSDDERAECLSRHSREIREQKDRETLDHATKVRQRILDQRGVDTEAGGLDQEVDFEC